jgi:hypothetical protein
MARKRNTAAVREANRRRAKLLRLNRKAGIRVASVHLREGQIAVVVDQGLLADALGDAGLIKDWNSDDRAEVEAALLRVIEKLARHA